MAYEYSTLDSVLRVLNEERCIERNDIAPRVLNASIWQAIVSFPGCLGDSFSTGRSRESALSSVEYWLDGSEDSKEYSARYVRGQLRRFGLCYLRDGRVITLGKTRVSDYF